MAYFLFLLTTATLFVRPAEIFPSLYALPIYNYLIIACLVVSLPRVLEQLSEQSLIENPITACVVGLLAAVVLSHLSHLFLWGAREAAWDFSKTLIYYLLLVAVLDSHERLRNFLRWLVLLIAVVAGVALLSWYQIVEFPTIKLLKEAMVNRETGEQFFIGRLQSTGVFSDPNDLAMILVAGVAISLYFLIDRTSGMLRAVYAALILVFAYSVYLTQSRGGFLALLAVLLTYCAAHWGWKRTAMLAAVALPLLLVVFKSRITSFDEGMGEGTGMSRLQLWSAGLALFRQSPLFGIGFGNYAEEVGQVAHNSFVHCFTELGFFGGAMFLGAFGSALVMLYRLGWDETLDESPELKSTLTCIIALVAGFTASMFSLSRCYVVPTYVGLGLATAFARLTGEQVPVSLPRFDSLFLKRIALASVCFLGAMYVFVRVAVRWS